MALAVPEFAPARAPRVAEFFAGIGLARLGLEAAGFEVVWANDIDASKCRMYTANFGAEHFRFGDVAGVRAADLPADLDLAWASFPCTDVSLAGNRAGLAGTGSGMFWQFARVLDELGPGRPPVVALENVVGLATSHGGRDIRAAIAELNRFGYWVDVLTIDARSFVPQSRQRLFIVASRRPAAHDDRGVSLLRPAWLTPIFNDPNLRMTRMPLPPPPPARTSGLREVVEQVPDGSPLWWDDDRTARLVESLSSRQQLRLAGLRDNRAVVYRTAYRRTRNGVAVWEIRADEIAGCLRTPRGGSSKQALLEIGGGRARARWMTAREYASLMGAGEYVLTGVRRNEAIFGFGDAVCVPAIRWLAGEYLAPLIRFASA